MRPIGPGRSTEFVFRTIYPTFLTAFLLFCAACGPSLIKDPILPGETILISLWVKVTLPNKVFQMYTGHFHGRKGRRKWAMPKDDSHIVSRTIIPEANTWTKVTAIHQVGPDWK